MKCPKCGDEYCDDIEICADCLVQLVPDDYQGEVEEGYPEGEPLEISLLDEIIEHMEFLGFKVEQKGDALRASHEKLASFFNLIQYEGGIIFESEFNLSEYAKDNREEYLEYVNRCNNDVPVFRALHNNDENIFILDAWFPGSYDKVVFERFIGALIQEISTICQNENFPKFLK